MKLAGSTAGWAGRARALLTLAAIAWLGAAISGAAGASPADTEPALCRTVRLADIGWTDNTAVTALTARLLAGLGYTPQIQVLAMPVAYVAMRNKDIDVFLGNWMPVQRPDRQPYLDDHSVEVVGVNLEGARYTLATTVEAYDQGLKSFADIAKFRDRLGGKIYGIEPGNDGNRTVLGLIKENKYDLGGFDLVESSEQGELAELDRAVRRHEPIVFLGWQPHPMNVKYRIAYLDDPTNSFGPDNGGATVYTETRAGYTALCPNVGRLVRQMRFSLDLENAIMNDMLFHGVPAAEAAESWAKRHRAVWAPWLAGVESRDGGPGAEAVAASLGLGSRAGGPVWSFDGWIAQHKIPLGAWLGRGVQFATRHGQGFFDLVSVSLGWLIAALTALLLFVPSVVLILAAASGAYWLHRSWTLSLFIVASLLLVLDLGYWTATVETLALVFSATMVCVVVGVPVGIAAAHRPWLYQALRPALDLMQTIPTFVYLIPTLVLFGLGVVPGLISTVIFAIPAPIRLTHLGISSVPLALREAGQAFGATPRQLLFKVELPYALPTIMAGITQCIMLSLSMVVIAALVGADGLGKPVVRALNSVNVAMGFEAGLAIVVLAIILDRVCKRPEPRVRVPRPGGGA